MNPSGSPQFPPTAQPNRHGRLFTLFVIFLAITVGFRVLFVATPEQRAEAIDDGRFAAVWEVWQALGSEHDPDESATSTAAARAVVQMAIVADEDPSTLSDRLLSYAVAVPPSVPEGLEDVWRAWSLLKSDYASVSTESLARAAISGLGEADAALRYLSGEEFDTIRDYFAGDTYEGIGAFVTESDAGPMIDEVFIGEPADRAGLMPGDVILTVDGVSTKGLAMERIVEIIKGPLGSDVDIEFLRPGETEPTMVIVTRATVPGPSIRSEMLEGEIAYIWLFRFHQETGGEFHRKLEALIDQGVRGVVLDMRGNPGGSVGSAIQVASEFLSGGIVMYEISNDGEREDWPVRADGLTPNIPLAVIVNRASASAAEVVAGAIQSHGRAELFGTRTYGKGSVQTFRRLRDGSGLYLTIARWYTPDGKEIQDSGIEPDVRLPFSITTIGDVPLVAAYSAVLDLADSAELLAS
jgi:carboxyl-terminal processing protease